MNSIYAAIEHVLLNLAANSEIKNTENLLHCGWSKGPVNNSLNLQKVAILYIIIAYSAQINIRIWSNARYI